MKKNRILSSYVFLETLTEVVNPNQPFLLQNYKELQSISKTQESFESGNRERTVSHLNTCLKERQIICHSLQRISRY